MPFFYKGVGVGTFLYPSDLRTTGIVPANPGAPLSLGTLMQHVSRDVIRSPFVSVSRSYPVAVDYAKNASRTRPTVTMPAYVYQIDIPDSAAGVSVIDPVEFVARHQANPLAMISYHHDGDPKLILAIVDPVAHATMLTLPPARPPGLAGGVAAAPRVSSELETMVNALRDAEILIQGAIPRAWVIDRFDIL